MLFAFLLAAQLPAAIDEWKAEIETRTFRKVEIVRLPGDPVPAEDQAILQSYFAKPDFADAFNRSQALTFRYETNGLSRSLVLLNMRRIERSKNTVDALISHELGHLWLAANGFLPPAYVPGPEACLAIHTGDIVQHILIHEEADRRGIEWRPSYQHDYEAAYESLSREGVGRTGDACFRAQRLSLMIDVRSGFAARSFAARELYLDLLAAQDPEAEAIAIELLEAFDGKLILEKSSYDLALRQATAAVGRLLATPPPLP